MIDGVFSTIIVVKRWLLRKSSGCGDRQVPHHAHHAQKATGLLPLLCDLFHVCHLRHLAFLAGQHLVLVDALQEVVALQNAMLNLFHLFDHYDLVHHAPMDRFVAQVEDCGGMVLAQDCPFKVDAMTIPAHGFGGCAPDPRLERTSTTPPKPGKNLCESLQQRCLFEPLAVLARLCGLGACTASSEFPFWGWPLLRSFCGRCASLVVFGLLI